MKPSVLITRPREESDAFAVLVERIGGDPVIAPVLDVIFPEINPGIKPDALVITSPQALKSVFPDEWKSIPLFVMGEGSLQRAREAGFRSVTSSAGDFTTLCALITKNIPFSQNILYLRGDIIRHDLVYALSEYEVREQIVYKTIAIENAVPPVIQNGTIAIVTLFSPRSAEIFKEQIEKAGLASSLKTIKALCLSPAVLESVAALPWQDTKVAPQPDQQGMLEALRGWI